MNDILFLDQDDIVTIHNAMLEAYGGMPGIKDWNQLDSIVAMPQIDYFGEPQFPGIFDKAAAYLYYFVTGHCFTDGNKRTGYTSAATFLEINGYEVIVNDDELFDFVIYVVESNQKIKGVRRYPYKNSEEILVEISHWFEIHSIYRS